MTKPNKSTKQTKGKQAKKKDWFKPKPYPHLSPKLSAQQTSRKGRAKARQQLKQKIKRIFEAGNHNFYPLLKYVQHSQQYKKKQDPDGYYLLNAQRQYVRQAKAKKRPIEYATHLDAQLYAYFAQAVFCPQYEAQLKEHPLIDASVLGYRSIPVDPAKLQPNEPPRNQSNIEMAANFFDEVLALAQHQDCVVFTFDIADFFPSLDHGLLFEAWAKLFAPQATPEKQEKHRLSKSHYRIYRAVTQYAYLYRNDLQRYVHGSQATMDQYMHQAFRRQGVDAYFASNADMRQAIRSGQLRIYQNKHRGIPHGLAISSHLANAYMWDVDQAMSQAVHEAGGHYRRYSDDIILVVPLKPYDNLGNVLNVWDGQVKQAIQQLKLNLSTRKSEIYKVSKANADGDVSIKARVKVTRDGNYWREWRTQGITYLGLELFGQKAGKKRVYLRPASIAKFQNKMRQAVDRAVRRAYLRQTKECAPAPQIFYNGLIKRFTLEGMKKGARPRRIKTPQRHPISQEWYYQVVSRTIPAQQGSVFSYARKMDKYVYGVKKGETGKAVGQFRNAKKLLMREIERAKQKYG